MTIENHADPVRAAGPRSVWRGTRGATALLVFDPAGESKHDELPATWRGLAEQRQIVWFRLATEGALSEAGELLADSDALAPIVDVVTSGPAAESTLDVVERHPGRVRSVLLVDPAAGQVGGSPEEADATWADRNSDRLGALEKAGVSVRIIAHSTEDERDRIPPPLPLGHPDVVTAVERALGDLDR
ncbi:hypothetical protein [Amycolatopsis anabasis]|uniref:hypothetical protein n=1 Tax=Amycolatopsis anabasis TaxID=1840409 RepID=UPI00131CE59D|nr:hypothetical protein [Amycolatopsis anabasis]